MSDFIPEWYEIPKTQSRFTKFEKDETTRVRVLPSWLDLDTIRYFEYFDTSWEKPKPIRSIKPFTETRWIRDWDKVKLVWSMKVWNYNEECIQIMSISQKTIQQAIFDLYMDDDYKSPTWYDLKIKRTGDKLETKYSVIAWPVRDFEEDMGTDISIDWSGFLESESDIFKEAE